MPPRRRRTVVSSFAFASLVGVAVLGGVASTTPTSSEDSSRAGDKATTKAPPSATAPAEFVARVYTEGTGRLPTQAQWNQWMSSFKSNGCSATTLGPLVSSVFSSREFAALPYTNRLKVVALYRAAVSREPDASGLDYWTSEADKSTSFSVVVRKFTTSSEFANLAKTMCSSVNYPFRGAPFKLTTQSTGLALQRRLIGARPGAVIELAPSELVLLDAPLVIPRGVTLTTKGSVGLNGRYAFLTMARLAASKNFAKPMIVLAPGAVLRNVWVDGQINTLTPATAADKASQNIRILDSAGGSKLQYVRADAPRGGQNVIVGGKAVTTTTVSSSNATTGDATCTDVHVHDNLIVNSSNLQVTSRWADGIGFGCGGTLVERNEILDPTDVGIIAFGAVGQTTQRSVVRDNKILNAGNSAFGGLVADPLSAKTNAPYDVPSYPGCLALTVNRNCDFTGLTFERNTLWTGPDVHYTIGISAGTRAWGFLGEAERGGWMTGRGATFQDNNSGISTMRAAVPGYVSGMLYAKMLRNFTSGSVEVATDERCPSSATQLYNRQFATGMTFQHQMTSTPPKAATATPKSIDGCI